MMSAREHSFLCLQHSVDMGRVLIPFLNQPADLYLFPMVYDKKSRPAN
jgi:hypothetical protein